MRKPLLLAPLVALLASACVSVHATRLGEGTVYPPVPQGEVRVYQSEDDVPGRFEKVALLFVEGDANAVGHRQMINSARKKAGRLGANAVILGEFRDPRFATQVASVIFDVPVQRRTQMIAIRLLDGAAGEQRQDEAREHDHDHGE